MRKCLTLFLVVATFSFSVSGQEKASKFSAFFDLGSGYTFNPDGPTRYDSGDEIFFGTDYFHHGIKSSLHFGFMYGSKVCAGLAARYSYVFEISNMRRLKRYYFNTYPDLNVIVDSHEPYQLRTLEMGPLISVPFKKNTWEAELLIGHSSMVRPYLFITGSKGDHTVNTDYYLYSYRPRQISTYQTLTPALSVRHPYGKNKYWFIRGEIAFGGGFNELRYELLNQPYSWSHLGEPGKEYFYYNCPGITGGIGIKLK